MADSVGPLAAAGVLGSGGVGGRVDAGAIDKIIAVVARGALASHIRVAVAELRDLGADVVSGKHPPRRAFSARVGGPVPDLAASIGQRGRV